jgi:hypothetical protein
MRSRFVGERGRCCRKGHGSMCCEWTRSLCGMWEGGGGAGGEGGEGW